MLQGNFIACPSLCDGECLRMVKQFDELSLKSLGPEHLLSWAHTVHTWLMLNQVALLRENHYVLPLSAEKGNKSNVDINISDI